MDFRNDITRLQEFFLIHSFLYYELDQSYLTDKEFEFRCRQLIELQKENPNTGKYWNLTHNLTTAFSAEAMGISGREKYPPSIRMKAYYDLYNNEVNKWDWYPYTFEQFCDKRGYY